MKKIILACIVTCLIHAPLHAMKKVAAVLGTVGLAHQAASQLNTEKKLPHSAPKISTIEWGKVIISQKIADTQTTAQYKDCKLYPKGSCNWDWNKTGTRHVPGIQPEDLKDFIDEVDIVVLSRGMDLVLQTKPETVEYLTLKKKEYHILQTEKAVEMYNKLVDEGKSVGALIHSTC